MSVRFFCRFLMNKWICPCRYVMKTMGRYNCTSSVWMVSLTLRLLYPHYPWDRSLSVRRPTPAGNSVPHRSRDTVTHCIVGVHLIINSEEEVTSCAILFFFSPIFPSLLFFTWEAFFSNDLLMRWVRSRGPGVECTLIVRDNDSTWCWRWRKVYIY
jgi:hypothetical protein